MLLFLLFCACMYVQLCPQIACQFVLVRCSLNTFNDDNSKFILQAKVFIECNTISGYLTTLGLYENTFMYEILVILECSVVFLIWNFLLARRKYDTSDLHQKIPLSSLSFIEY
jgi:hypothetical protein